MNFLDDSTDSSFFHYMNQTPAELLREYKRRKREIQKHEAKRGILGLPQMPSMLLLAMERKNVNPE